MARLNKRFCDSVQVPVKGYHICWDGDLPGYGLLVTEAGHKSFVLQYRNESGRTRRLTLGKYGVLTPTQARKMALEELGKITKGEDVAEIKALGRKGLSMAELAERYLAEHAGPKKKPWSVVQDKRLLEKIILPAIGSRKIDSLTRADFAKLHHSQRDTPIQANRVLALCSKMFNLAEAWGLRPDNSNPCRHIERYKENRRERFLSGDELSRLGAALLEAEKTEIPSAVLALRLLLFTGARLNEILSLKWADVDLERGILTIVDSKTGRKLIPLPGPGLDVLSDAPRLSGNPYVCFGNKPGHHLVGLQKIWERIRAKADLGDVRHHDLRHSFASVAAANNMGLPIIGKLLGHTQAATTARYAHLSMDPLKAASEEIARRIDADLKRPPRRTKVVELRPGGKS